MTLQQLEHHASFSGWQDVYQHQSSVLNCQMRFAIYIPAHEAGERLAVLYWLSGLTCNEQNFVTKAGAQQYAAQHKIIIVAPDTSPRGQQVADDDAYDLGQGAGFYLNATQAPWAAHYQMYDYIVDELPTLIEANFPTNQRRSLFGHSMGGHGALTIALKNPQRYASVSAFSPIVAPSQVAWGQKAFRAYLGNNSQDWQAYDTVELIKIVQSKIPMLVEQGLADNFLQEQLKPHLLQQVCQQYNYPLTLNMREGYDHSYYFISSFIGEHIAFHAQYLNR